MSCREESKVTTFQVGYPEKDDQGNAITGPDGIQLEVQAPGSTEFVVAGTCVWPNDKIKWTHGKDGKYIFQAVCFTYAVKGPGNCGGSCKRYGPESGPVGVVVHDARPGAPPNPIALVDCCNPGAPSLKVL